MGRSGGPGGDCDCGVEGEAIGWIPADLHPIRGSVSSKADTGNWEVLLSLAAVLPHLEVICPPPV